MQTATLACNYFDRYISEALAMGPIQRSKLQMIASTCLLISAKFIDRKLPPLSELVVVHNHAVTATQLAEQETEILRALQWQLHVVLPVAFLAPLSGLCTRLGVPISQSIEDRMQFFMDLSVYGECS